MMTQMAEGGMTDKDSPVSSPILNPENKPVMAEGGMVPATASGTPIIAGEGGEPEVVAPLSKLGTLVNVDNSELKGELAKARTESHQTNMLLSKLVQQNENYFGFGGTVASGTGRAIASGLEESKRFRGPTSVRIYGDLMYVTDCGSHRIQVYKKEIYELSPSQILPDPGIPFLYNV